MKKKKLIIDPISKSKHLFKICHNKHTVFVDRWSFIRMLQVNQISAVHILL